MPKADDTPITSALYKLGRHPRRPDHHALLRSDGTLLNTFAIDATRDEIAAILARGGLVLHDDDTVTRAADAAPTRRGVLSGLAMASLAGATVALAASPAAAAEHPDAALLVLCAEFEAASRSYNGMYGWAAWGTGHDIRCSSYIEDDDDRTIAAEPHDSRMDVLAGAILDTPPVSLDGFRALARCLVLSAGDVRDAVQGRPDFHIIGFSLAEWRVVVSLLHGLTSGEISDATCMDAPGFLVLAECEA